MQTKGKIEIDIAVLKKIPAGRIVGCEKTVGMDRKEYECLVVEWMDPFSPGVVGSHRKSLYSTKTGDYISEY
jgi:hypothetical protein